MEYQERLRTRLHFNMALIGGFWGAYAVIEFGTLSNAHTTNLIKVSHYLSDLNWSQLSLYLMASLLYCAAFVLAAVLRSRTKADLRYWVLAVHIAAMPLVVFFPEELPAYVRTYPCIFATAFQWSQFSGAQGFNCATIFNSNNFRQFSSSLAEVYLNHDDSFRPKLKFFGLTLLFYHVGAVYAYSMWKAVSRQAVWFCLLPLITAAVFIHRDRVLSRIPAEAERA